MLFQKNAIERGGRGRNGALTTRAGSELKHKYHCHSISRRRPQLRLLDWLLQKVDGGGRCGSGGRVFYFVRWHRGRNLRWTGGRASRYINSWLHLRIKYFLKHQSRGEATRKRGQRYGSEVNWDQGRKVDGRYFLSCNCNRQIGLVYRLAKKAACFLSSSFRLTMRARGCEERSSWAAFGKLTGSCHCANFPSPHCISFTEMRFNLWTWLGEDSSCSCSTVLPGPACQLNWSQLNGIWGLNGLKRQIWPKI